MESTAMAALEITEEVRSTADRVASELGIPGQLHEDDHLLRHMLGRRGPQAGTESYFKGGRNDAAKVVRTIESLRFNKKSLKILDFAAGYGRVARHAKYLLPKHDFHASDIHEQACAFLHEQLQVPAYQSSLDPTDIEVGRDYDFIYVLSLFSHLPDKTFGDWIGALCSRLAPEGYLLFTTNGEEKLLTRGQFFGPIFDVDRGFGFRKKGEQQDLDGEEYGLMVVSMPYVLEKLKRHAPAARVYSYRAGAMLNGQDEWIVQRVT